MSRQPGSPCSKQSLQGSLNDERKLEVELSGPSLLAGGGHEYHPNQLVLNIEYQRDEHTRVSRRLFPHRRSPSRAAPSLLVLRAAYADTRQCAPTACLPTRVRAHRLPARAPAAHPAPAAPCHPPHRLRAQMWKVVGQSAALTSLAFFIYEVVGKLTFADDFFLTHRNLIVINTVVATLCVAALTGTGIALLVRTLWAVRWVAVCACARAHAHVSMVRIGCVHKGG